MSKAGSLKVSLDSSSPHFPPPWSYSSAGPGIPKYTLNLLASQGTSLFLDVTIAQSPSWLFFTHLVALKFSLHGAAKLIFWKAINLIMPCPCFKPSHCPWNKILIPWSSSEFSSQNKSYSSLLGASVHLGPSAQGAFSALPQTGFLSPSQSQFK